MESGGASSVNIHTIETLDNYNWRMRVGGGRIYNHFFQDDNGRRAGSSVFVPDPPEIIDVSKETRKKNVYCVTYKHGKGEYIEGEGYKVVSAVDMIQALEEVERLEMGEGKQIVITGIYIDTGVCEKQETPQTPMVTRGVLLNGYI